MGLNFYEFAVRHNFTFHNKYVGKKVSFNDQWKVKMENGQVRGPFPSESISKMIVEGVLTGQEEVSLHPNTDWRPLTKVPEFYEALLESLENPTERDEKKAAKMDAETQVEFNSARSKPSTTPKINKEFKEEIKQLIEDEIQNSSLPVAINNSLNQPPQYTSTDINTDQNALITSRDEKFTIEMLQLKKIQTKYHKKFLPLAIVVIFLIVGLTWFLTTDSDSKLGWILISPQKKTDSKLTTAEVKNLKAKAVKLIKSGVLENVRDSQKFLVQAIESAPNDLEALGFLCVAYEQLWPYTKQNAADLKAVTTVTQMSRTSSSISSYSDTCQSVYLLVKGQMRDAQGLIERTLDQNTDEKFMLSPFLYYMKGEILEDTQSYVNAEAYYSEAIKTFPGWVWAQFALARVYLKQNKTLEAKNTFASILDVNPNYRGALFGMALVETKNNSTDKALDYFRRAYAQETKLPKAFIINALFEYVQLLVSRKDNSKALEIAQYGLVISPSHKPLKDIVMSLGGEDNGNSQTAELIFLGNQFVRSGDHLAAQAQFKAAYELDTSNAEAALKAAKSLWALNQSKDALSWIDRAIKSDRKFAQAYALKADYLSSLYAFAEATKTLSTGLKICGQNFDIIKGQALVEFRKNSMLTAISYGEKALKIYDADVELLSLIANANISLYINLPSKEDDNQRSKYRDNAQKYSGKAVELEPGKPEAQITSTKYIYIKDGSIAAENNFKKLIEIYPYTVEYQLALADFYEFEEKYSSASALYEQMVQADPKNKKALMGLARSRQHMNDYKNAKKYYLEAALLDPSDVEPLFSTAQLELENSTAKNIGASVKSAYNKFITVKKINPNYPLISFFLARCYFELADFDKALEFVNEEKSKNPGVANSYLLAAAIYNAKKQFKECAAEYSQAIKLRPNSAELYVKAATCYRKSDALEIALDLLEIARTKESGYPPLYNEKGYVVEALGDKNQARSLFQLYLELSPNALDRKQIEDKIKQLGGK